MRKAQTKAWPAPVKGLVRNDALVTAPMEAAEWMENFIPTAQGARLRGGSQLFATVDDPVKQLLVYHSGNKEEVFAATADAIYDVTAVADPEVAPTADVSSLASGDWSYTQFATSGGEYMLCANGADSVRHYNGTTWATPTITGVTSSTLSFVWGHKKRLWFIKKDTLSAYHLDSLAIAGAATEFPMTGIFRLGGSLLFGGAWSLDSGDGLDDAWIVVTTEGEIAVYQGDDPTDANSWGLSGVYRIGRPLGKNAWFRAGGDLAILTEDGIVSVGAALNKDRAALQVEAITYPIEELWQTAIANRTLTSSFATVLWPTKTMLLVSVPSTDGKYRALVANTRTGAWSTVTGWDIQCAAIFDDRLFFGTSDGLVIEGDVGGNDMGLAVVGACIPKHQDLGTENDKVALHARATWRADGDMSVRMFCHQNFVTGEIPVTSPNSAENATKWGGGAKWGSGKKWGSSTTRVSGSDWQSVAGMGFSVAPGLAVAVNRVSQPQFDIVSLQLRYEVASAI